MSAPFQIGKYAGNATDRAVPPGRPETANDPLEHAAAHAMRRSAGWVAMLQARDGHWCAELTADTTLESDYILFQLWLHPPVGGMWSPATQPLIEKAVHSILLR